jgi:oligopeptide/dipeptide ABC transporter ATP-binding protein
MKQPKNLKNMNYNMESTNPYLLKVDNLKTYFAIKKGVFRRTAGYIRAVDGVSFSIKAGQTLGLVGESGCGKTTAAKTIVRLVPATSGSVVFKDMDVLSAKKNSLKQLRREISIIFQDPYGSLNPRMTVGNIIGEPIKIHKKITGRELVNNIVSLLSKVGLSPEHINRYPHEFSGGQRQRIGIARALSLGPKLVICDEPISALDVSIQSQILNLLKDLQSEFGLTYLFIAHNLAVVEFFCDFVAVMYMGKIVEQASTEELYRNPLHPYTRTLMLSIPQVDPKKRNKRELTVGEISDLRDLTQGCSFAPRCQLADNNCFTEIPVLNWKESNEKHLVACWKCKRQ